MIATGYMNGLEVMVMKDVHIQTYKKYPPSKQNSHCSVRNWSNSRTQNWIEFVKRRRFLTEILEEILVYNDEKLLNIPGENYGMFLTRIKF